MGTKCLFALHWDRARRGKALQLSFPTSACLRKHDSLMVNGTHVVNRTPYCPGGVQAPPSQYANV